MASSSRASSAAAAASSFSVGVSSARVSSAPLSSAAGSLPSPNAGKTWGAYVGWQAEEGAAFEAKVGKPLMIRATFVHWGNEREFPSYLGQSLAGRPLVVFWEAMDYNAPPLQQPNYSYAAILRGDWDAYFTSFADQTRAYGKPVILIPFEEMNGDWYAWSGTENGNTPADHIAAYRYIRGFFRDVQNVKFGWAVNSDSVPDTAENSIAKYYPGDEYVDVVGVDGFNFGNPWRTFDQIYGRALAQLKTYQKPLYIFSMASADGPMKANWIRDALGAQMQKHPEITGWIWFNEKKERDWRVWSDEESLRAFQSVLP